MRHPRLTETDLRGSFPNNVELCEQQQEEFHTSVLKFRGSPLLRLRAALRSRSCRGRHAFRTTSHRELLRRPRCLTGGPPPPPALVRATYIPLYPLTSLVKWL